MQIIRPATATNIIIIIIIIIVLNRVPSMT